MVASQDRRQTEAQRLCTVTAQWPSIRQHERTVDDNGCFRHTVYVHLYLDLSRLNGYIMKFFVSVVSLLCPRQCSQRQVSRTEAEAVQALMPSTAADLLLMTYEWYVTSAATLRSSGLHFFAARITRSIHAAGFERPSM